MPTLEEIRTRFQEDRFATVAAGAEIILVEQGHAVCRMELKSVHLNANNVPMGGAIFTLADFAFAVAANGFSEAITVSQHNSVTFLSPAKGKELIAEAECLKAGKRTCLYQVNVHDELGVHVAHMVVNGFTMI